MSDSIIQVRGLGKSYNISHEGGKESYTALRDIVANKAKKIFSFPKSLRTEDRRTKATVEEFWALKDVSFDVQQGDRVGIIGRNGAGKSTLLKILSRITEPTKGEIRIKGRVASLLEVGTGFHPELTGRENIYLNGAILGMSRSEIKRKFDEIVDFAEVEKFLDTPVKRYSSGMYVRLAFAVAAHLEPEILVIDEVLAVGDTQFQKKCLMKMNDVSDNEGKTILFVSHNLQAIQKLCTKLILLNKGSVLDFSSTGHVINSYLEMANDAVSEYEIEQKDLSNKPAYTTKLRIESLEGVQMSEIPIGKPWRVKIHFTVTSKIENLIIALGMIDNFENAIRTSWSLPVKVLSGDYIATFTEDIISFSTGRYRLVIGISQGNHAIEYIDRNIWFVISDIIEQQDSSVISNSNGVFLNPMKINIDKVTN